MKLNPRMRPTAAEGPFLRQRSFETKCSLVVELSIFVGEARGTGVNI
jgi:hypothetical protein